ncbi:IclR family transcriptional regulator [Brevibacterium sp. FME17]|uniref:IclR family transcriptional regulator n=1 Tax=Brevibacterium sp. FME17 TaxID=2742606 RepID=UPI001865D4C5|nr:IclR family transcriptional regulator [Brevibacterium sp. FME17]
MTTADDSKYRAPAAICAADVLLAVARSETRLNAGQLSALTGHNRSLVYRAAKSLVSRDFLEEYELQGSVWFRLGPAAGEVGGAYQRAIPFQESIRRQMGQLSERFGETVSVGRLEGTEVRYLMREEGRNSVVALSHVGKRLPAHATAIGKALLADLDWSDVRHSFGENAALRQLTDSTIHNLSDLKVDLVEVGERGYAVEYEEVVQGRCCVAVTIPGFEVFGTRIAMSMSMPRPRFDDEHEQIAADLLRCAAELRDDVRDRRDLGGAESLA